MLKALNTPPRIVVAGDAAAARQLLRYIASPVHHGQLRSWRITDG